MRPHAPDIELTVAANRFLLAPRDGTARLRAAVADLDGAPMNASLRALRDAAVQRLAGRANDAALREALLACCESVLRRRSWEDAAFWKPSGGATYAHRSHQKDAP